jgi:aspartyl-tRNA(Asn)/glutamyl-tRNA(Gln) amidotransferase subunit A
MQAARQADDDLARGVDRGPLQGIPLAIKDILATRDAPTTANSRVLDPKWGDRDDATVVRKLREAGAVILGKASLHEFALGWPDPDTGFRVPKNPWDLTRSPGGSSSGTGGAISTGMVLGGLGTDTGGSVRNPCAYCGISGIKPTFGRVSKDGCVPLAWSLDHIGPMARTARDCAVMLQVMAGYDPADPTSVDVPVPEMTAGLDGSLEGIRVGLPQRYFYSVPELDAYCKSTVLAAVDQLKAAGATVVDVDIPHARDGRQAQLVIMLSEAYAYHEPDLQQRPELYGKFTRQMFMRGALFSAGDYIQAQRMRSLVKAECAEVFKTVDVLVTPAMIGTAPTLDSYSPDGFVTTPTFTGTWNSTGLPAMVIPCGAAESGLPIGVQIIGRPFDEPTVFKVADAYQRRTEWHMRVPDVAKIGMAV